MIAFQLVAVMVCGNAWAIPQTNIPYLDTFPEVPSPLNMRDWQQTAEQYNAVAFNTYNQFGTGPYLPLLNSVNVVTPTTGGYTGPAFGLPSYVNDNRSGPFADAYNIQMSNDASVWSNVYSTANGTGGYQETVSFPETTARYIRMNMNHLAVSNIKKNRYGVSEFEVRNTAGGNNLALDKISVSSSNSVASPAITDGHLGNGWSSQNMYDLLPTTVIDDFSNVTAWNVSQNAGIATDGSQATITGTGSSTYGFVSRQFSYNVDDFPIVKIVVPELSDRGKWALTVSDGAKNYYLQGDTVAIGEFYYDLKSLTAWSGEKTFTASIYTVGGSGSYVKADGMFAVPAPSRTLDRFSSVWSTTTNATISSDGNLAKISEVGGTYGVVSKNVSYDLDVFPYLQIKVPEVSAGGKWALKVNDGTSDIYVQGDTANTGTYFYNLKTITGWSGSKSFSVRLLVVGGAGSYFKAGSLHAVTGADNAIDHFSTTTAWGVTSNAQIATSGSLARVTETGGSNGYVQRSVSYNLDQTPLLKVVVPEVDSGAKWVVKVNDGSNDYYVQGDTAATGVFAYDLKAITGWSGTKTFNIRLMIVGGAGRYFTIQQIDAIGNAQVIDDFSQTVWGGGSNATISDSGHAATITSSGGTYGYVTRSFSYDVDQYPFLQIHVSDVGTNAKWALKVSDGIGSYYLQGDTVAKGTFKYDVKLATGWSANTTFDVQLLAVGSPGATFKTDQLDILAGQSQVVDAFASAAGWGNAASATLTSDGDVATVTNTAGTYGRISKSFTYDVDTYPLLEIKIPEVGSGAKWALKVGDGTSEYYLQGDSTAKGTFIYDLKSVTNWIGTKTFSVVLLPVGGSGKYFKVDTLTASASYPDCFREWLYVDLGQSVDFDNVTIRWGSPYGEALTVLGAILGGSLAGIDKSNENGTDWVEMSRIYYSVVNNYGLVANNADLSNGTTRSFWYDLFPTLLFYQIGDLYPAKADLQTEMKNIADSWLAALPTLSNNWNHTAFNFATMQTEYAGHNEPDAAIGIAYLEYMAYKKWGDVKYLNAAIECMTQMENYPTNPYYEILGSYGPLLAARMNVESGQSLNVDAFLQYVFTDGTTDVDRKDWGMMNSRWGNYDAYGLSGSLSNSQGYAFAMNTFVTAGAVASLLRYAPQYSNAIGKYLLAVANNANLFYPDTLPAANQENADWVQQTGINSITYEGVKKQVQGKPSPYATGDREAPALEFDPYGAWGAGYFAAMFRQTNIPQILQVDLLKTDFFHEQAYPTSLYYNPLTSGQDVEIDAGSQSTDLYDLVSKTYVATGVTGSTTIHLDAGSSAVLVKVPHGGQVSFEGSKLLVDNVVVDYTYQ